MSLLVKPATQIAMTCSETRVNTHCWSPQVAKADSYQKTGPQAGEIEHPLRHHKPNTEEKVGRWQEGEDEKGQ